MKFQLQYKVIAADGRTATVPASSQAAARHKGRGILRLSPTDPVRLKRSLKFDRSFGGMKVDDQMDLLMKYSRLLTSKTPLEVAYERLGDRALPRGSGEPASNAFARSGVHPVACAILSVAETAGQSGEGADRAADWLAEREKRRDEWIRPATMQTFFSIGLMFVLFALPLVANGMFNMIPTEYVTLQHTPLSQFLLDVYENVYSLLNPYVSVALVWAVLGSACFALTRLSGPVRDRLPLLGPLGRLGEQEQLTAWLSMYMPFHASNLPFADFVRAGSRAFKSGMLARSFAILLEDVESGEADSLATAAAMHPDAVPGGLNEAIVVMADMDEEAGQKHLKDLMMLSGREMRRLAGRARRQGKILRNVTTVFMMGFLIIGIYGPLTQSIGTPSF